MWFAEKCRPSLVDNLSVGQCIRSHITVKAANWQSLRTGVITCLPGDATFGLYGGRSRGIPVLWSERCLCFARPTTVRDL
jgi:hypothetical protein